MATVDVYNLRREKVGSLEATYRRAPGVEGLKLVVGEKDPPEGTLSVPANTVIVRRFILSTSIVPGGNGICRVFWFIPTRIRSTHQSGTNSLT